MNWIEFIQLLSSITWLFVWTLVMPLFWWYLLRDLSSLKINKRHFPLTQLLTSRTYFFLWLENFFPCYGKWRFVSDVHREVFCLLFVTISLRLTSSLLLWIQLKLSIWGSTCFNVLMKIFVGQVPGNKEEKADQFWALNSYVAGNYDQVNKYT